MFAGDFAEHRDISGNDRQFVLCGLNQRQAEAFAFVLAAIKQVLAA